MEQYDIADLQKVGFAFFRNSDNGVQLYQAKDGKLGTVILTKGKDDDKSVCSLEELHAALQAVGRRAYESDDQPSSNTWTKFVVTAIAM